MKVHIDDPAPLILKWCGDSFEAVSVSMDPQRRYAVTEVFTEELFIFVKVISVDETELKGVYLDHYLCTYATPMLMRFSVNWEHADAGFCKLRLWAPELVNEFGGSFEKTVKRFRFDDKLKG